MGIARRLGKLISADIHGMLDLLEDPADICKQALRDMEEEIAALDERLREACGRLERIMAQHSRCKERISEALEQLTMCLKNGDEGLARVVIKRKIEQEKLLRMLSQQQQTLEVQRTREEKQRHEYAERMISVREKLACFNECDSARTVSAENSDAFGVTEEEIEIALLKVKAEMADNAQAGEVK